jgi:putative membrane protein
MSVFTRTVAMAGLTLLAAPAIALQAQVVAPGTNPQSPTTNPPPASNPAPTSSATPSKTGEEELRNDLPFLREAASANLMEVTLGRVAQSRGSDTRVKDFGGRMVTDHTNLQQQLTTFTSTYGVGFTPRLTAAQEQEVNRLQSLSGSAFDRAYITAMVQDHQTDVAKFEDESRNADSPRVRELAMQSLPVLQQHLSLAQRVAQLINVQVATTTPTPTTATGGSRDVKADRKFILEVDQDAMLETSLGELAQRKAQNSNVKTFAQRIAADHSRQQQEWKSMATSNGQEFTQGLGKKHKQKLTQLQKLSGREFDRAFMSQMVEDHKDYIDYFEKEGRSAHSAQVRELVQRDLPMLKTHFTQAKQIGAQVGADTSATLRSERLSSKN